MQWISSNFKHIFNLNLFFFSFHVAVVVCVCVFFILSTGFVGDSNGAVVIKRCNPYLNILEFINSVICACENTFRFYLSETNYKINKHIWISLLASQIITRERKKTLKKNEKNKQISKYKRYRNLHIAYKSFVVHSVKYSSSDLLSSKNHFNQVQF